MEEAKHPSDLGRLGAVLTPQGVFSLPVPLSSIDFAGDFLRGVVFCRGFVRNHRSSGRVCGRVNRSWKAEWDSAILIPGEGWLLEVIT